jgi:hypothetical protein
VEATHISIAVCGLPQMIDDIICLLVRDAPDADVVARIARSADLDRDFERSGADLLICCVETAEMEALWQAASHRRPTPAFLNLGADFTRGDLYAVHAVKCRLEDLTAGSLLDAFREHMRSVRPCL